MGHSNFLVELHSMMTNDHLFLSSISYLLSNSLLESLCWNSRAYMSILEIMSARRVDLHHWFLPDINFKWKQIPALALRGYNLNMTVWQMAYEHYPKIKIFHFSTPSSSPSPSHLWKNHDIMDKLRLEGASGGHTPYSKQAIFDVWSGYQGFVCPSVPYLYECRNPEYWTKLYMRRELAHN